MFGYEDLVMNALVNEKFGEDIGNLILGFTPQYNIDDCLEIIQQMDHSYFGNPSDNQAVTRYHSWPEDFAPQIEPNIVECTELWIRSQRRFTRPTFRMLWALVWTENNLIEQMLAEMH